MKKKNFVIAGGGTGGHIYPGLAMADFLKERYPDCEVHFVGAHGGLEEKIIPKQGYPLHLLSVGRFHRTVGWGRRIKAFFLLPCSLGQALFLFFRLRPLFVLGIGGFASAPFVFMASILGGKTALLEPNAFPGMANRYLSRFVRHCFVVFETAAPFFPSQKLRVVGLPVRLSKKPIPPFYDGRRPFRVLIFGGSQGARQLNKGVGDWVESLHGEAHNFEIFHQTGHRDIKIWENRYGDKHQGFLCYGPYIEDMPRLLDWADLVICRAGIGSVAEVAMASRPAIFVPLSTAADNHQVKNAQFLVKRQAAKMIQEKDFTGQALGEMIQALKDKPQTLVHMASQLKDIDYSTAPQEIMNILMGTEIGTEIEERSHQKE